MGDPLTALWADAIDGLQFGGAILDHRQNLGSESPNQLLRENRPDALYQSAPEIPLDALGGGGRHRLHHGRLELQPVLPVPDPTSLRDQPFPGAHGRERPHDCRLLPLTLCLYAEHTKAAVVVVEGDALYDAGNFLGRGSALWHGGGHDWDSILPRMDGAGVIQYGGTPEGRIVEVYGKT
jgi:hypothetical protein